MSARDHLHAATDLLSDAADATDGETADRLATFADRVGGWADGENDPDHGALANVLLKLEDIADEADEETAATIREARTELREFRKTVEGV